MKLALFLLWAWVLWSKPVNAPWQAEQSFESESRCEIRRGDRDYVFQETACLPAGWSPK